MNLDLISLYRTLSWHSQDRDHPTGQKVGLFIQVPEDIAAQFPKEGKAGEDSSPPHITLLYIGSLPPSFEQKMLQVVENVCDSFKCFSVKLGKVQTFTNEEGQKIYHSPIISKQLQKLHETLKIEFEYAQLPYSTKYPEFKPHITIEYVNACERPKFSHICPKGSWEVDSVWVWRNSRTQTFLFKIILGLVAPKLHIYYMQKRKLTKQVPCIYCSLPSRNMGHYADGTLRYDKECSRCHKLKKSFSKEALSIERKQCQKCSFIAEHPSQMDIDHIDGNHKNNEISNLMVLCANCHRLKTALNKECTRKDYLKSQSYTS